MNSIVFRQFTHWGIVKACGVVLLQRFFAKVMENGTKPGAVLPALGTGEKAENEYYRALIELFREPEKLPENICEVLYRIDALANAETADRLTTVADENKIKLQNTESPTEAEVALQIWLEKPEVFDAEYSAQKLQALRTFTHFLSREAGPRVFKKPTATQLLAMAAELRPWFKKYGRGENFWITEGEIDGEWWFVIDHGERMNRTGMIEKGQRQVRRFRPEKDDVLVYNPAMNTIRTCAGTIGVKRQFRDAFGEVFFGNKGYFPREEIYRFEPLCDDPEHVLDCNGVPGIKEIRLVELRYRGNAAFKEIVTRRATDVLAMFRAREKNRDLPQAHNVYRSSFELVFEGADIKPRPVKITSRGTIQIARDCDHKVVHGWLQLKNMELSSGEKKDERKK